MSTAAQTGCAALVTKLGESLLFYIIYPRKWQHLRTWVFLRSQCKHYQVLHLAANFRLKFSIRPKYDVEFLLISCLKYHGNKWNIKSGKSWEKMSQKKFDFISTNSSKLDGLHFKETNETQKMQENWKWIELKKWEAGARDGWPAHVVSHPFNNWSQWVGTRKIRLNMDNGSRKEKVQFLWRIDNFRDW